MDIPDSLASPATTGAKDGLDFLSINQRARRYPRMRIIAKPVFWTKVHLDLLQCSFSGPCIAPSSAITFVDEKTERLQRGFDNFFGSINPRDNEVFIRGIMVWRGGPLQIFRTGLNFHLGGYRSILLDCRYFCLRGEHEPDHSAIIPLVAHVELNRIAEARSTKIFGPCAGRRRNGPGLAIGRLRHKMFTANESLHEPYVVALLIALGQTQWWSLAPKSREQTPKIQPKVLFTIGDEDKDFIY